MQSTKRLKVLMHREQHYCSFTWYIGAFLFFVIISSWALTRYVKCNIVAKVLGNLILILPN
jgi:hypothetical protein